MEDRNVFSDETEKISLLIHTESILEDRAAMEFFCNVNKISKIRIYFMPILSQDKQYPLTVGEYSHFNHGIFTNVVINFSDCSSVIFVHNQLPKDIEDIDIYRLTEEKIIDGQIETELFDYIVTEANFTKQEKCNKPVVSLKRCKELLRLFLVQRKAFSVNERYKIDETLYYIYKHKQLFSEFQNYWSAVIEHETQYGWADALDNRLCLLTICLDKCKIEALKRQNNLTVMHLKYNISHLILLVTGTFDNIAWIINNQYKLNLNRMKIDLRKSQFKKSIKGKSLVIYDELEAEYLKTFVDAVRDLRDRIVHRDFIKAINGKNSKDKYETSYFWLDNETYSLFIGAGFRSSSVKLRTADAVFVDMIDFIGFLQSGVVKIIDGLLKIIADEIYESRETYEIWQLLEFPEKPYVL